MNNNSDHELIERISPESVRVRFEGVFDNESVIWNAHIRTLQDKFHNIQGDVWQNTDVFAMRQSIDISENAAGYIIEIVLNLAEIDEAAIKRTIIMVRKYKRLHLGFHEYGEVVTFKLAE